MAIKQRNSASGIIISQDKLLGEGQYTQLQRQCELLYHTLALCHIADLNIWVKVKKLGKLSESFMKLSRPKRSLHCYFKRLTLASNRIVSNPEGKWILIESLALETANSKYKRVIKPLILISALIGEYIRNTTDIWSHTMMLLW